MLQPIYSTEFHFVAKLIVIKRLIMIPIEIADLRPYNMDEELEDKNRIVIFTELF